MLISFLQNRLKDISIARKLYFTVGIMALLVSIEMCTLYFSISTLSAVRAYVSGEGLWSKAEKDAIYQLRMYALSRNEKDYQAYQNFLKVPLGDSKARLELQKPNPDFNVARQGFIEGRNYPADVDGMINLVRRFHTISYINRVIVIWGEAEHGLTQIMTMGDKLHQTIKSKTATQPQINKILGQIDFLNRNLTKLEDEFSFTLGQGSRWLEGLVLRLLLTLSLTIGTTGILITISVSRSIEKGLKAIINGASLIGKGILNTRVKVYSKDEIGVLATSFNQMTDTLEHNIGELRDTQQNLQKEKERAESSEKAKQLFLANMSHEIRTPMNAILGFARLLEESLKDKEQLEYIRVISKSGDDLLVILNDILDFSRMEAGKITFESAPFDLNDIMHSTATMMGHKANAKNVKIAYSIDEKIPPIIIGDAIRLNQVLLNLITNSIKFTEEGSISLLATCIDENKKNLTLEFIVKDTGIGIPYEKQTTIFESFEQATTDTARKFGGTGLGLSIVKQLVELQGGKVFVNSTPGLGSEFHFSLPFLKGEKPVKAPEELAAPIQSGQGISILIAEDNPINQLLVNKVLKKQGFETDMAENGLIALDKYNKNNYDIILMDLQMPEMDGYETTRNIRMLKGEKGNIPIIAMTAHTIKGETERCMEIGMNDFVSKPFNPAELYTKIFEAVTRAKKRHTKITENF